MEELKEKPSQAKHNHSSVHQKMICLIGWKEQIRKEEKPKRKV